MSQPGMLASLRELFSHVSPKRRRQLGPVLALMLAGALAELVSIGAILPFLALIADPSGAASGPLGPLFGALGLSSPFEVVLAAAVLFGLAAVVAAVVRLWLVWVSQSFVFGVAHELSTAIYQRVLQQDYAWHTAHNSSETLGAIGKAQTVAGGLLVPVMQAASAAVIALFIVAGLIIIDPLVALGSAVGFAGIYLIVVQLTRGPMHRNGSIIARAHNERVQAANEGLGGIRDILLDDTQPVFVDRFDAVEGRVARAHTTNNFVAAAPRFIVEGLGVVLLAALALMLSLRAGGLLGAIPVLGALALGAQRLIPLLQQVYQGWASAMTNGRMLVDILDTLRLPRRARSRPPSGLPFEDAITLERVTYSYPSSSNPAVKEISLRITKGTRVGIVGKTGSGKSTLTDIVMGLLNPDFGEILVDGVKLSEANYSAWHGHIAHVPQSIYLADLSMAENIAFGVQPNDIDLARVQQAAEQAELADVIAALPNGYETFLGERGVRLSGGQRQRVGIARALYKNADVLVLDEATSSLDTETEAAVMRAIARLDRHLTIIVIAHRMSTVQNCDQVFRLNAGVASLFVSDSLVSQ